MSNAEVFPVRAADGISLHVEAWRPTGTPRFVVVVAHGGAEHVSRYQDLAQQFTELGGLVFGPDHRGQGRSGGPSGHVESFENYAADLLVVMRQGIERFGAELGPDKIPWFLFGHSMGGLISLTYLLDHEKALPLRGVMISAPLLGLAMKVPGVKRAAAKVLNVLAPQLAIDAGIPAEYICRDAEEVERYANDDRRQRGVTPRWADAMDRAIARVSSGAKKIESDLLVYVGSGDLICDHKETLKIFGHLGSQGDARQRLHVFDGYYHELHNEPADLRAPVYALLREFVADRVN